MMNFVQRALAAALTIGLAAATTLAAAPAEAQSPSVLRVARGLASNNITVVENRAVVVESAQPFIEVSVAQPSVADVSPLSDRALYVFGRSRGITTLTLLGEGGQLITNVMVQVIPDIATLKAQLAAVVPDEDVEVRVAGGQLILSGTVSSAARIEEIMRLANIYAGGGVVNMMTVGGTQQVMLKVRVAEMSRQASKALGISLGAFGEGSDVGGFITSGSPAAAFDPSIVNIGGVAVQDTGLGLLARFGDFGINLAVDAFEGKGFARTLAEPNIVALSGQSASFLVGDEIPIPVEGEDGVVTIEFKRTGVVLDFTPRVLTDDIINLRLSAEVSNLGETVDTGQGDLPSFNVNRSTTTVELKDGDSFAIAGLIRETFTDDISQFPILGDVPILGTLFRSASYLKNESELVIIVSAHLVTPVDGDLLAIPHDRITVPNERELFLLGQTAVPTSALDVEAQDFDGGFGYVVE